MCALESRVKVVRLRDSEQGRWAGSAGGLGQNVSLFEWLLKGRGVGCLPKDAEKPTRGGTDGSRS